MKQKYKFLPHTADVKIQAFGSSLETAFINSALALKEAIAEKAKIKAKIKKSIRVKGKDKEALLYSFLEEFIYQLDANNFILGKIIKLTITQTKGGFALTSEVIGDKFSKYNVNNEVKAITYNDMLIKESGSKKGQVLIQFVLDV